MENILRLDAFDMELKAVGCCIERPTWAEIEERIKRAFAFGGSVKLFVGTPSAEDRHGYVYSSYLGMESQQNKFRLIYSPKKQNLCEKSELREWWESNDFPFRGVELLGDDEWDARTVCMDILVAMEIFRDLFEHCELSGKSSFQFRSIWDRKTRS